MEVIIADGMSEDGSREILREAAGKYDWIRIIDNPGRIVSTGLNLALARTRHDIVLRMDVHTEYAEEYVTRCVETLLATGAVNVGGPARTRARGYMQAAIAAAFNFAFAVGNASSHFDYEGEVDSVSYGCWHKQTLLDIGGYDDEFRKNQDDELNYRLIRAGYRIWQNPAIRS